MTDLITKMKDARIASLEAVILAKDIYIKELETTVKTLGSLATLRPSDLTVGDMVKLKKRVEYKCGLGKATPGDIGVIKCVHTKGSGWSSELTIDFPNHRGWLGDKHEVSIWRDGNKKGE